MATRNPSAAESDAFADRRAAPRVPVALPAFLQSGGVRQSVRILDLSSGGAKLDCQTGLQAGTAVVLDCGMLRCEAVVRWENGGAMGIRFDRELTEREVGALADRSTALAARMNATP